MKEFGSMKGIGCKFCVVLFLSIISIQTLAQTEVEKSHGADGFANSDHAMETVAWYSQPWFWALIAAALVLVIGYLAPGRGRVEKTSERGVEN